MQTLQGGIVKNILKTIEKIRSGCPEILGTKADIVIRTGNCDGLIIEATWYCAETYSFGRAYSSVEINNAADDSTLVDLFIYECKRQVDAVKSQQTLCSIDAAY